MIDELITDVLLQILVAAGRDAAIASMIVGDRLPVGYSYVTGAAFASGTARGWGDGLWAEANLN